MGVKFYYSRGFGVEQKFDGEDKKLTEQQALVIATSDAAAYLKNISDTLSQIFMLLERQELDKQP